MNFRLVDPRNNCRLRAHEDSRHGAAHASHNGNGECTATCLHEIRLHHGFGNNLISRDFLRGWHARLSPNVHSFADTCSRKTRYTACPESGCNQPRTLRTEGCIGCQSESNCNRPLTELRS